LTTGTYKLKTIFTNEDNALFPNQFVNVHLLVDTKRNLVIVPAAAIQRGPQGTYVYAAVKDPAGKDSLAKIVPVTIAQTTGDSIGLSAGLNPNDAVVIDGQDKLQDGTKIRPSPAAAANPASASSVPSPAGQIQPPGGKSNKARSGGASR
jgi:multidrug efflux system membrane fusion protein